MIKTDLNPKEYISSLPFNLNSSQQLQEFLYEFLKLEPLKEANEKGNISTDEAVITYYAEKKNIEFCKLLLNFRKVYKALHTYIADIERNISTLDYKLHPEFWLNIAETFRSSATDPNFQNQPKHGDMIEGIPWEIIRSIIGIDLNHSSGKLLKDYILAEVDYDGAEVKVAGMLSNDPVLIDDLNNDFDMHSHWAIELFGLKGMTHKEVKAKYENTYRFLAKNNFTFADIFGAIHYSIAESMRESEFYREYVYDIWKKQTRIKTFDAFYIEFSENQVKQCQEARKARYKIYTQWQDGLVTFYNKFGYVENPFGFRRRYPLTRNELLNMPIQSTSYLLLQDSINQIEDEMEKNESKWKSRIIAQIHDSGFNLLYKPESYEYMEMVNHYMTQKSHLPWTQKVKMKTDWSVGRTWNKLKKVKFYNE